MLSPGKILRSELAIVLSFRVIEPFGFIISPGFSLSKGLLEQARDGGFKVKWVIKLNNKCKWLHEILEEIPLIKYPFKVGLLPKSGIYFFYEDREFWGHGGNALRIVRIGTHKKDNFRNRVAEHFLFDEVDPIVKTLIFKN